MSTTLYITLTAIAIVIETIFTPLFLKAQRPGICHKSRFFKMICASMFVAVGALAFIYSGNKSDFALFMLLGLCSSWFGDLFLHYKGSVMFGIGLAFFTGAHVLYLIAFSQATEIYFPERAFVKPFEIILVIVALVCVGLYYALKKKMKLHSPAMLPCDLYGVILSSMLVKSVVFSIEYIAAGFENAVAGGILLIIGGVCFFMSDTSLGILMFSKPDKKRIGLKNHNIGTYFVAQTALALTILFIGK